MENTAITIWEAMDRLKERAGLTDIIELPILDCLNYILAKDLYTQIDQPPFPRSAMDGYAVKAEDVSLACPERPVHLKVAGCQYAGDPYFRELESGEALRIMTGAAIPNGADAVIRQEDTDYGDETVTIYESVLPMDNYCAIGEDFPRGVLLAKKGDSIDAYLICAAVAAGIDRVKVYRKVRAAVITTGDELQEPGSVLGEGKIYNSNLALFSVRLKQLGCQVLMAKAAGDDLKLITGLIEEAKKTCDLIITTGGVSVGIKDLIPEAMEQCRAQVLFHGIKIKPGMPTMASVYEGVPVISLSGNPYSAAAVFELLVQPLLAAMTGKNTPVLKKVTGISQDTFSKKTGCTRFLRGYFEDGQISFSKGQKNGQTKSGIGSNCLICLEPGRKPVAPGEELTAYLI